VKKTELVLTFFKLEVQWVAREIMGRNDKFFDNFLIVLSIRARRASRECERIVQFLVEFRICTPTYVYIEIYLKRTKSNWWGERKC